MSRVAGGDTTIGWRVEIRKIFCAEQLAWVREYYAVVYHCEQPLSNGLLLADVPKAEVLRACSELFGRNDELRRGGPVTTR